MKFALSALVASVALSVIACGGSPETASDESEVVSGQQQELSKDTIAAMGALVEEAREVAFRPKEDHALKSFLAGGPATRALVVDVEREREFLFTHGPTMLRVEEVPTAEGITFWSMVTTELPPGNGRAFTRNDLRAFNAFFSLVSELTSDASSTNSTQLQNFLKSGVLPTSGSLTPSPNGDIEYQLVGSRFEGDIVLPGSAQLTIVEHQQSSDPIELVYTAEAHISLE